MRRGDAWKALRDRGGWMHMSERAVFYVLLERSDNGDCSIPAFMTPSLVDLAEACCCSESAVKLAPNHLERHGWITRKRVSKPGRGHKTAYQLADGSACPPDCQKRAGYRPLYDGGKNEGLSEGEDREGEPLCIGGCGKPARHGCSTCWEHARLELAQ